jgi:hypothetical protein
MPAPDPTTSVVDSDSNRAVSQVVGFVLLFSLIVLTASIVYVVGFEGIGDSRDREALANAERAFDVLAGDVTAVREGTPSRSTRIRLSDGRIHTGQPVHWNVTAQQTTGSPRVNRSFTFRTTPVIYTLGSTRIVYSGGMVIRTQRIGDDPIQRRPSGVLGPDRAVFPLLNLTAADETAVGGRDSATVHFRRTNGTVLNTTDADRLQINVTSPRAAAWRRYFNRSPGVTCAGDHNGSANCTTTTLERVTLSRTDVEVEIS